MGVPDFQSRAHWLMVGSTHLKSGTPTHPNDTAVAFGVFQTMHKKKSSEGPNPNERPILGTQNDNNFTTILVG